MQVALCKLMNPFMCVAASNRSASEWYSVGCLSPFSLPPSRCPSAINGIQCGDIQHCNNFWISLSDGFVVQTPFVVCWISSWQTRSNCVMLIQIGALHSNVPMFLSHSLSGCHSTYMHACDLMASTAPSTGFEYFDLLCEAAKIQMKLPFSIHIDVWMWTNIYRKWQTNPNIVPTLQSWRLEEFDESICEPANSSAPNFRSVSSVWTALDIRTLRRKSIWNESLIKH